MQHAICLALALLAAAQLASAATDKSFGEYYPHTRWIEPRHHMLTVDAYPDHLVISRRGQQPIVVRGCWRGRAFLRQCRADYFAIAYEGRDAAFFGQPPFSNVTLKRVRPDPTT
jgi:hypothetical protein